jgi:hypothetical protein
MKNLSWKAKEDPPPPTHRAHRHHGVPDGPYSSLGTQQDDLKLLQAPISDPKGDRWGDRKTDGGCAETERTFPATMFGFAATTAPRQPHDSPTTAPQPLDVVLGADPYVADRAATILPYP